MDLKTYIESIVRSAPNHPYRSASYKSVDVADMPKNGVRFYAEQVCQPKQCYWNCATFMLRHGYRYQDIKYVCGLALYHIPVCHAWLFIDGQYYDPTFEVSFGEPGKEYLSFFELTNSEFTKMLVDMRIDHAPTHLDILNFNLVGPDNFISSAAYLD